MQQRVIEKTQSFILIPINLYTLVGFGQVQTYLPALNLFQKKKWVNAASGNAWWNNALMVRIFIHKFEIGSFREIK